MGFATEIHDAWSWREIRRGRAKTERRGMNTCAEIQSSSLTELVQDFFHQLLSQNADA